MKNTLLFIATAFSLCLAGGQPNEKSPGRPAELRTEHQERRGQDGKVSVYTDTVFRGNVRVMTTVKLLTKNKYGIQMMRDYFADGKIVVGEVQYEDGTQMIRLYQDGVLCEEFRRRGDGSVEPVSSEELAKRKGQHQELLESLKK